MARVGLLWGVEKLAALTSISRSTISRFENEKIASNASTRATLRRALEEAGAEFIDDYGVHIRRPPSLAEGGD